MLIKLYWVLDRLKENLKVLQTETYLTASFYPSTQFWNLSFPRQWRTCCPLNPDSIHRLFSPAPLAPSCTWFLSFASVSFAPCLCLLFLLESWSWWDLWTDVPLSVCLLLAENLQKKTHSRCSSASAAATHTYDNKRIYHKMLYIFLIELQLQINEFPNILWHHDKKETSL